jgi:hypothetical protein
VGEKLFNAERVDRGIEKLRAAHQQKKQVRIDEVFKPAASAPKPVAAAALASRVGAKRTVNPSAGVGDPATKAHRVGAAKKAVRK